MKAVGCLPRQGFCCFCVLLMIASSAVADRVENRNTDPATGDWNRLPGKHFLEPKVVKLLTAARDGDLATIKAMLDSGVDIDSRDPIGDTALGWAAWHGQLKAIKLLLDRGADINVRSISDDGAQRLARGCTPLQLAAARGNLAAVKLIYAKHVAQNMSKEEFDRFKMEALYTAGCGIGFAGDGPGQFQVCKFLVNDVGMDVKALTQGTNVSGAIVFLIGGGYGYARDLQKFLVERGANVNARDEKGETPLAIAAGYSLECTQYLLAHGADINVRDSNNRTILSRIAGGALDGRVFPYLLSKGAPIDLDAAEFGGQPTLYGLMVNGLNDKAKLLLAKGADVNVKGHLGKTALILAAEKGNVEGVALLIANGADVNAKADNGDTALKLAAQSKEEGDKFAAANPRSSESWKARASGYRKIMAMLRKKGAKQ